MDNLPQLSTAIQDEEYRSNVHKILGELLINIVNKYFKNQTIDIDGYRFINCIFENCEFVIKRGTFEFHSCKMGVNLFRYGEEAQKIIQLMSFCDVCDACSKLPDSLKYLKNNDGTISIGKGVTL